MKSDVTRKIVKFWVPCGLFFAGLLLGVRFLFPLQLYNLSMKFALWRNGVREFQSAGFSGYVRDNCDALDPEARGCTCVALIHGLADNAETWSKFLMAPQRAWAKPVKLYALNVQRNQAFAANESPELYRVRNQASQIEGALGPLCSNWVLVGNSLGAWEAAWIALDGKLKIEKLIFIDGAGTRSSAAAGEFFMNPTIERMQELMRRIYYKPPKLPDSLWPEIVAKTARARPSEILQAQQNADYLDGRLALLRIPTMVIWGAEDQLIPEAVGKEIQANIPNSIWREIPDCGHVPQKECPTRVIEAINDMLRVGTI